METMEKAILGFALVIALSIGAVFASAAVTNTSPSKYVSSITVPSNVADNSKGITETKELTQLTNVAKITKEQAKTIATSKFSGIVNKVELDNENGNVVYSIEITKNSKQIDVKVDAGNGKILKVESGTEEGHEKGGLETESAKGSEADKDGINHEFQGEEKQ